MLKNYVEVFFSLGAFTHLMPNFTYNMSEG